MPDLISDIEQLAALPIYREEKPYTIFLPPGISVDDYPTNLQFEKHRVTFTDIRGLGSEYTLEKSGFEIIPYGSCYKRLDTAADMQEYRTETENFLREHFDAILVICYDSRFRKNVTIDTSKIDPNDPMRVDRKATGAHVDVSFRSGPNVVNRRIANADQARLIREGYRYRIVNTWRSLIHNLEDNPIAVCDYRSIDQRDLIDCERIFPDRVAEFHHLRYNPNQKWCWLEHMSPEEPIVMIQYDSYREGDHAIICPHVTIENPRAQKNAALRYSIETRCIVISKI